MVQDYNGIARLLYHAFNVSLAIHSTHSDNSVHIVQVQKLTVRTVYIIQCT